MKLAIAILSWNGKHYLEKFLPGVIEHSSGAEVCVIDNASDDGTAKFLEKIFLVSAIFNSTRIMALRKDTI